MYEFKIKKDDNKRKYFEFDKIPQPNSQNEHYDLFNILKQIIKDLVDSGELLKDKSEKSDSGKRIYLEKFEIKNRTIYGQVEHGHFGNEQIIKHVPTNSKKGVIGEDDGVFEPYYFLLVVPKKHQIGCLILERKGNIGIRNIFQDAILRGLVNYTEYAQYKITLHRAVPKELKEWFYEKGELLNLKYYLAKVPEDYVDETKFVSGKVETTIKVDDKQPTTPKKFLERNKDNLLSFGGIEYEVMRVDSKYKGKIKSFTIGINPGREEIKKNIAARLKKRRSPCRFSSSSP